MESGKFDEKHTRFIQIPGISNHRDRNSDIPLTHSYWLIGRSLPSRAGFATMGSRCSISWPSLTRWSRSWRSGAPVWGHRKRPAWAPNRRLDWAGVFQDVQSNIRAMSETAILRNRHGLFLYLCVLPLCFCCGYWAIERSLRYKEIVSRRQVQAAHQWTKLIQSYSTGTVPTLSLEKWQKKKPCRSHTTIRRRWPMSWWTCSSRPCSSKASNGKLNLSPAVPAERKNNFTTRSKYARRFGDCGLRYFVIFCWAFARAVFWWQALWRKLEKTRSLWSIQTFAWCLFVRSWKLEAFGGVSMTNSGFWQIQAYPSFQCGLRSCKWSMCWLASRVSIIWALKINLIRATSVTEVCLGEKDPWTPLDRVRALDQYPPVQRVDVLPGRRGLEKHLLLDSVNPHRRARFCKDIYSMRGSFSKASLKIPACGRKGSLGFI